MINIVDYKYNLPEDRIAKYPLDRRDSSKLLIYDGLISEDAFYNLPQHIGSDRLIVINNTKVIRARLLFTKDTGARIEVFCLEPNFPADYERAFSAQGHCSWHCIIGNAKRFKGEISITDGGVNLRAKRGEGDLVEFSWDSGESFGELLEILGKVPIPPYLNRDSCDVDTTRYQTTYAVLEGSVAAPTAGLHFTDDVMNQFSNIARVTLHVGAGTFLPVKETDAKKHVMHNEHIVIDVKELEVIASNQKNIIAVGTTSVRTLESLAIFGQRIIDSGDPQFDLPIGQWEAYNSISNGEELIVLYNYMKSKGIEKAYCSTQIMITAQYKIRTIAGLVTNFHQPESTLLLLISAVVGDKWREIYKYAMDNGFRFLSYGDSSLLMCSNEL